jgi:hypothetical protein
MSILPIVVGAVAYWALGALWYSVLFGKTWSAGLEAQGIKLPEPTPAQMRLKLALTFVGNLGATVALSWFLHRLWPNTMLGALRVGFIAGAGIAATALAVCYAWESKARENLTIDAGFHTVGLMVAAAIVYAFGA